jgi:signal transduction histidine kinase
MRVKWFIFALILVVLPAAILSTLAARAIRHYELIMQAELEQDASRVLSAVDSAVRDKTLHALEMVRITLATTLTPDAGPEKLTPISRRIVRENGTISDVFVFMNPWGFLATSVTDPQDPDTSIRLDFLVNELRLRLANSELSMSRRSGGGDSVLSFFKNARAYYFAPMPGTASVWAGYAADRMALDSLLTQCIQEHTAGGMVLSYVTDSLRSPNEDVADVVVSDSLSPESLAESKARERGTPGLPILASIFLAPPLDAIEILAQAAPGIEIQQIAAARTRLYGWGLAIVVAWVLLGIGIVLRQTVIEIRQARQRGEFLLGVSHDLRTPLASMRMLAESLAQGNVRKQEQPRFMNTIVSECDRLARLIERVLYLVRYGQGALVYHQRDVDMGTLVQKAVADMKAYAHSLQLKIEPDLPHIQGDRSALAQVVLNLLDNAIKYGRKSEDGEERGSTCTSTEGDTRTSTRTSTRESSPADDESSPTSDPRPPTSDFGPPTSAPPVRVELTIDTVSRRRYPWNPTRRWVRLTVRDFGMGIARHEQRRIFHRFYRSSRAHDRNVSGVGLGLALCRHVIRSHGGWIEVASEVGEGTTFSVYLKCG